MDCVDLIQLHNPVTTQPQPGRNWMTLAQVDEAMAAFADLRAQGKVRFWGMTGLGETAALHEALNSSVQTIQSCYNLLHDSRWNDGAFTTQLESLVWTSSPLVRRYLHRLATGDPDCDWLTALRSRHLPAVVRRALVLGCGSGWLERALADKGGVHEIVACDEECCC